MSKYFKTAVLILSLTAMIFLLIKSETAISGAIKGLTLCSDIIIPTLFPFAVFSLFIFNANLIDVLPINNLKINKTALSIFLISLIGGYPIGAKLINNAYKNGKLSKHNACYLLMFCVNSGPSFVISAVGYKILGSKQLGFILLCAHILSSLQIYLILMKKIEPETKEKLPNNKVGYAEKFVNSVSDAGKSTLGICYYVVIFSTVGAIIQNTSLTPIIKNTVVNLFEVTNAVISTKNIYLISFYIGFSGLSIIFQVISFTTGFSPNIFAVFTSRIIHGILSVINTFWLLKIIKPKMPTYSNIKNDILNISLNSAIISLLLIFTIVIFLISINSKKYCGRLFKDIV